MAVYKVAQDVEAEDKLIGPFGFRQFIYLIVVALAGAMAWGLSRMFLPLFIIPVPVMIFFGALALPLRKDQPMETYLAALVSFYIKPRRRLWLPDGIHSLVEVTAPKDSDDNNLRPLSERETEKRLSYLADIADTRGWAVRNTAAPAPVGSSLQSDVFNEAQQTRDLLDDNERVAQSFDSLIDRAQVQRRQKAVDQIKQAPLGTPAPNPAADATVSPVPAGVSQLSNDNPFVAMKHGSLQSTAAVHFDPYPTSIHQTVITPLGATTPPPNQPANTTIPQEQTSLASPPVAQTTVEPELSPVAPNDMPEQQTTSETTPSPDIINLANNTTLSVETIAHEAKRLSKKDEGEVLITLR